MKFELFDLWYMIHADDDMYDVIIVGASFAGLSVAGQLKGKVLLIDRQSDSSSPKSTFTHTDSGRYIPASFTVLYI